MRKPPTTTKKEQKPTFSRALRKLRLQSGLTQTKLANKIGVTAATVSKWELDPSIQVSEKNLQKLSDIFRVTTKDLTKDLQTDLDLPGEKKHPLVSKLRKFRIQEGLTQHQLAKKTDTTSSYISFLEVNPLATPSKKVLKRIAKVLGKPISDFWDDSWERKDLTEKQRVLIRAYKQFPKEDRSKLLKELNRLNGFKGDKEITDRDTDN